VLESAAVMSEADLLDADAIPLGGISELASGAAVAGAAAGPHPPRQSATERAGRTSGMGAENRDAIGRHPFSPGLMGSPSDPCSASRLRS
jgi:hypothetical protein